MQSKQLSFLEAVIGTAIGFAISWALLTFLIVPVFHLRTNMQEDFLITCIFTVASVLRSYGVRRAFNWWHRQQAPFIVEDTAELRQALTEELYAPQASAPNPNGTESIVATLSEREDSLPHRNLK